MQNSVDFMNEIFKLYIKLKKKTKKKKWIRLIGITYQNLSKTVNPVSKRRKTAKSTAIHVDIRLILVAQSSHYSQTYYVLRSNHTQLPTNIFTNHHAKFPSCVLNCKILVRRFEFR